MCFQVRCILKGVGFKCDETSRCWFALCRHDLWTTCCAIASRLRRTTHFEPGYRQFCKGAEHNICKMKSFATVAAVAALATSILAATVVLKETPCLQETLLKEYTVQTGVLFVKGEMFSVLLRIISSRCFSLPTRTSHHSLASVHTIY